MYNIYLVVFAENGFVSGPLASLVRVYRFRIVARPRSGPETYKRDTLSERIVITRR